MGSYRLSNGWSREQGLSEDKAYRQPLHPLRDRAAEKEGKMSIVAVTSYAMVGDREKALAAGCTGYIEKPINPVTFIGAIQKYF